MRLPRATTPPQRPVPAQGFTLVELLVTAVLGSVVIGAITTLQLSELRVSTGQDLSLQLRQEANRAAAWIDSEISRASGFDNTVAASCTAPSGTSLRFSVRTQPNSGGTMREVSFFSPTGTAVGNVVRCGPPVVCTANTACALDLAAANVTYLVASNARLDVTSPLDGTARRTLTYTLTTRPGVVAPDITRQAFAGAPGSDRDTGEY
jgi:prepilin-type N-terminal cleavage/methylation domain-containing protein